MLGVHSGIPVGINGNFFMSPWWKLRYHGLDFGWGQPVYAGPIVNNLSALFVLALSNGSEEGIRVWITLGPYQMEKFEQLISKL
jgi:omega-hydroxypalmitate O-feruloyl transferase